MPQWFGTVNGARVQAREMQADNGVVHSVDTVIMPANETIKSILVVSSNKKSPQGLFQ
jgi:hypothetical protein